MRTIFALCAVLATAFALPLSNDSDREMVLVPDEDGHFHYVDLKMAMQEAEAEPFFTGEADMQFLLFTRSNPTTGHLLQIGNAESLFSSNFNPNHPTRFIFHGWGGSVGGTVNRLVLNAYHEQGDFNVISVDWSVGSPSNNYVAARSNVGLAGEGTARLLQWLGEQGGLRFETVSLIGHSLGAHVAGMAGKLIPGRNIDTIFGLDPALPLFSIGNPAQRLDATDATYVEVIHTNAGLLGFDLPIGDTSFYPNGGRSQPGCVNDLIGRCAHARAIHFFAESIHPTRRFNSIQCATFDEILNNVCTPSGQNRDMGGEPSNRANVARGIFFLTTNEASPFSQT